MGGPDVELAWKPVARALTSWERTTRPAEMPRSQCRSELLVRALPRFVSRGAGVISGEAEGRRWTWSPGRTRCCTGRAPLSLDREDQSVSWKLRSAGHFHAPGESSQARRMMQCGRMVDVRGEEGKGTASSLGPSSRPPRCVRRSRASSFLLIRLGDESSVRRSLHEHP